jgi:hypothetical protein
VRLLYRTNVPDVPGTFVLDAPGTRGAFLEDPRRFFAASLLYAPTRIASLRVTLPSKEAVWLREASMSKGLKLEIPSTGTMTLNQRMAALDAV